MFICPKCKKLFELPVCGACGNAVESRSGVWQLTDAPDIVTDGDGDKYIGYERIGEAYSGDRRYLCEERDLICAKHISEAAGDGTFLDLACGDGKFTVPCAANGTRIIAGDISNKMISILVERARRNGVSLENVTLCRMNALDIPLEDGSVDCVVGNSFLHLISNPEKVVKEIHRVLKRGGRFICFDDRPGQSGAAESNEVYEEIANFIYSSYWQKLISLGVQPKKYSWRFDRDAFCSDLFERCVETVVERNAPYFNPLRGGFLARMAGKGFSDQAAVPDEQHETVMREVTDEAYGKYGELIDTACYRGVESDIVIKDYFK